MSIDPLAQEVEAVRLAMKEREWERHDVADMLDALRIEVGSLRVRCDQQERGIKDAIGFVRTGGPLYSKDRLELLAILSATLPETEGEA